jgi:hypothetical protein
LLIGFPPKKQEYRGSTEDDHRAYGEQQVDARASRALRLGLADLYLRFYWQRPLGLASF